jgi:D-glycero-D-manno-heptose 1,7-bisphosphate phosphatase
MGDRAVFLDRDGTINVEKNYLYKIADFELIPGSLEALKLLSENNVLIYVVTNQAGIARGHYTERDFQIITDHMLEFFEKQCVNIEQVLYCPHHPEASVPEYKKNCNCRKPANGLIKSVVESMKLNVNELALIGDKNTDIEAGLSLGMKCYLVETGYGSTEKATTKATFIKPNLHEAVKHLLKEWRLS